MAPLSPDPDTPDAGEDARTERPRFVNWLGFLLVGDGLRDALAVKDT